MESYKAVKQNVRNVLMYNMNQADKISPEFIQLTG